jgi:hypothetical protein
MRSTRPTLFDSSRPLVRLTSAPLVGDDHVPPLLTFRDVELLHHRLKSESGWWADKQLEFLGWACKAYEGELRRRRDYTMKARLGNKNASSRVA